MNDIQKLKEWFEANYLDGDQIHEVTDWENIRKFITSLLSQAKQKENLQKLILDIEEQKASAYKAGRKAEREEIRNVIEKIDAGGGGSGRRIKIQLLDYLDGK